MKPNHPHLQRLQQLLLQIPKGRVTTYQEIGRVLGTNGYRFVGQLVGSNPEPNRYPCYKVVRANGDIIGFALGIPERIRRLKKDGLEIKNGKIVDFEKALFKFS